MDRNHIQWIRLIFPFLMILATNPAVQAVEFAGGTGTPNDPYQIATAEQLVSIGSDPNLLDKHFAMVNDIDLDPNLSPDYVFDRAVIAAEKPWFTGVFDGNGFRIRHLTIQGRRRDRYHPETLGLFEEVLWGGEVKRLGLEDVNVASFAEFGSVGALCGGNLGNIFRCSVTGTVSGLDLTGGLTGFNEGLVEECRSVCRVSGEGWTGGLIANNTKGGEVRACYTGGRVSGQGSVGGLVGDNTGNTIHYSYSVCQVNGKAPYAGGLVGRAYPAGSVPTHSYFLDASDGGGPDNGIGIPLTHDQMKQPGSFIGWDFWGIDNDGFRVPWFMPEDGCPELSWLALAALPRVRGLSFGTAYKIIEPAGITVEEILYDFDPVAEWGQVNMVHPQANARPGTAVAVVLSLGPYDWSASPGAGDANDPYLVFSPGQLDCLAHQPQLWDKCFRLISDLDMAWRICEGSLLGGSAGSGAVFDGTFDGGGHIIRNLTMEEGSVDANGIELLGLFGETGPSANIKDLGLKDIWIRGQKATGGMLCALNRGRIERCYSLGILQAYGKLGGLVGTNAGLIEDCYAMGEVADVSEGMRGEVNGGLVAENVAGTIRTCYATCLMRGGFGLVGRNIGGSVEYSLWDMETSDRRFSNGGTGLLTQELMDIQVLRSHGWGGNPNWVVDDGKDYPRLIWEGMPGMAIP